MTTADATRQHVIARLKAAIGPGRIVTDPRRLAPLAHDQLRRRRGRRLPPGVPAMPLAAVRPAETEHVVKTLCTAAELGVPVVQYGGGTGLMGGALSLRAGIVLDMRAMRRVLAISREDRTATAQAGAVLADLDTALAPHGLILGHDPWTVPIATVGGTISTNSLGYRGGRYGSMGDQVLGLEIVLMDGSVVRTRAVPRSSTGPRLHQLFVGAEGAFGVITEATLRVFPAPERRELLALDFPSFEDGFATAQAIAAVGLVPALLDFGAPPGGPGRMYLGFEGLTEEAVAVLERARRICAEHGGRELPGEVAQAFWVGRHVHRGQLSRWRRSERHAPDPGEPGSAVFDYLHVALPASRVLECIRRGSALFGARGIEIREWGLWHGPELLSLVIFRRTDTPAELDGVITATDEALMLAQDLGGSMEYVHGAGLRYAHLMAREHGAGLDVLRAIKHALDPDGLLNPGKLGLT